MLNIKIKKCAENAQIPTQATDGSAGYDMYASSLTSSGEFDFHEYNTGIAMTIPKGYVGLLFPRSSITKKQMMLKNSVGVLDSDFLGSISYRFVGKPEYQIGDRIGQIVVVPCETLQFEEVTELENTARGEGGYGSTGN